MREGRRREKVRDVGSREKERENSEKKRRVLGDLSKCGCEYWLLSVDVRVCKAGVTKVGVTVLEVWM